jgi:hypothetical protein
MTLQYPSNLLLLFCTGKREEVTPILYPYEGYEPRAMRCWGNAIHLELHGSGQYPQVHGWSFRATPGGNFEVDSHALNLHNGVLVDCTPRPPGTEIAFFIRDPQIQSAGQMGKSYALKIQGNHVAAEEVL